MIFSFGIRLRFCQNRTYHNDNLSTFQPDVSTNCQKSRSTLDPHPKGHWSVHWFCSLSVNLMKKSNSIHFQLLMKAFFAASTQMCIKISIEWQHAKDTFSHHILICNVQSEEKTQIGLEMRLESLSVNPPVHIIQTQTVNCSERCSHFKVASRTELNTKFTWSAAHTKKWTTLQAASFETLVNRDIRLIWTLCSSLTY